MGSLNETAPLLQDLRVTLLRSSVVCPPGEAERRSMFLSNIDQVLDFDVDTVHFFQARPDFPPEAVAERLQSALGELLGPYDFLAGRMAWDGGEGRWALDCNGAGAGFVVAASELTLAELGDLELTNPAFRQLVPPGRAGAMDSEDKPLFVLQVTSFKCGGFAVGMTQCHTTMDGLGFRTLLENLAALAAGDPLVLQPFNDRRLLAARCPPRVSFPHPELLKLDSPPPAAAAAAAAAATTPVDGGAAAADPRPSIIEAATEDLEFKVFRLSSDQISALKDRATAEGGPARAATSFNVVTAHLWRCKALAGEGGHPDKVSTVLYAVDVRGRLRPPLPRSYAGNAVLSAYGALTHRELEEGPLGRLVGVVREGSERMDDEYARSVVDWGQLHKGFPHGDVFISSWWRLGFDEVEFPWGRALHCSPLAQPRRDIIVLFPTAGGVGAMVSLPAHDMKRFERRFHEFM